MQRRRRDAGECAGSRPGAIRPIDYIAPTGLLALHLCQISARTMRKPPHLRDHNITIFAHSVTLGVAVPPCEPWTCTPKNFARAWRRPKSIHLRTLIRDTRFPFFPQFLSPARTWRTPHASRERLNPRNACRYDRPNIRSALIYFDLPNRGERFLSWPVEWHFLQIKYK